MQDHNVVVKEHGTPRTDEKLYNHVDLVQLLDIVDLEKGTAVAGAQTTFHESLKTPLI